MKMIIISLLMISILSLLATALFEQRTIIINERTVTSNGSSSGGNVSAETCDPGNYSYYNGTGFNCRNDETGSGTNWSSTIQGMQENITSSNNTYPWTVAGTNVTYTGGNVGIGTSSPEGRMHTAETAFANLPIFERYVASTVNPYGTFVIRARSTSGTPASTFGPFINMQAQGNTGTVYNLASFGAEVSGIATNTGMLIYNLYVSGTETEKMRLNLSGLGLFTKTPSTSLDVNGTSTFRGTTNQSTGNKCFSELCISSWADLNESISLDGIKANITAIMAIKGLQINRSSILYEGYSDEFMWTTLNGFWGGSSVAAGTIAAISGDKEHPGVMTYRANASVQNINSGYYRRTEINTFLLSGSEITENVFQIRTPPSNSSIVILGFSDSLTTDNPTDCAMIKCTTLASNVTTCFGMTGSNGAIINTTTNITLSKNQWYTAIVEIINTTLTNYKMINSTMELIWNVSLVATVPSTAGRETGLLSMAILTNNGTASQQIMYMDYQSLRIKRDLLR